MNHWGGKKGVHERLHTSSKTPRKLEFLSSESRMKWGNATLSSATELGWRASSRTHPGTRCLSFKTREAGTRGLGQTLATALISI